ADLADSASTLLFLLADVHLDVDRRITPGLVGFFHERIEERLAIKRMNDAEQLQRFGGLVRLQPTDPVESDIRIARKQRRPFSERLLHPALAEISLPCGDKRLDLFRRAALADGDQLHVSWVAPRELRRGRDALEDVLATICGAHAAAL